MIPQDKTPSALDADTVSLPGIKAVLTLVSDELEKITNEFKRGRDILGSVEGKNRQAITLAFKELDKVAEDIDERTEVCVGIIKGWLEKTNGTT